MSTGLLPLYVLSNPSHITGLKGWWSADYGVFSDAGSTPAAGDGTVQQWNDRSGAAGNVSQSTSGSRPTYKTSILNGRPVLRFDGTDDCLSLASAALSGLAGSLFFVLKPSATTGLRLLLTQSDEASTTRLVRFGFRSDISFNRLHITQQNADTADAIVGGTTIGTSSWLLVEFHSNGTAYTITLNGVDETLTVAAGANGGDWFGDVTGADNLFIGALTTSGGTSSFFAGDMAEAVVYDALTTAVQRLQLRRYFNRKYGLGLSL